MPVGPAEEELARLDAAVVAVNTARAALLAAADTVTAAATALDGADEACATGQRELAANARSTARAAVARVDPALAGVPQQVEAYRTALAELQQAAESLDPAPREALQAVAAAGEQEALALTAFRAAAGQAWPAYSAVDSVQSTWLDRASAGWFRTQREAADAYVVLRRPVLPALDAARSALQEADAARRPATRDMRAAVAAADAALDVLRAPPDGLRR